MYCKPKSVEAGSRPTPCKSGKAGYKVSDHFHHPLHSWISLRVGWGGHLVFHTQKLAHVLEQFTIKLLSPVRLYLYWKAKAGCEFHDKLFRYGLCLYVRDWINGYFLHGETHVIVVRPCPLLSSRCFLGHTSWTRLTMHLDILIHAPSVEPSNFYINRSVQLSWHHNTAR